MSQIEIMRFALNNRWFEKQAVPDMNAGAAMATFHSMRNQNAWK
jgi:hypothetical protein